MAADVVGLLDALEIKKAHIVGMSMGGMIAQELAIHFPERLHTVTSIMSTTSHPNLPQAKPEILALLAQPVPATREAAIEKSVQTGRVLNGPFMPFDEERARSFAARSYDRDHDPTGPARQMAAILASGSRRRQLGNVTIPSLVIHGDADPLVLVEGGIDTAESIPNANLLIIEGMGHASPRSLWPQLVEVLVEHIQ